MADTTDETLTDERPERPPFLRETSYTVPHAVHTGKHGTALRLTLNADDTITVRVGNLTRTITTDGLLATVDAIKEDRYR